MNDSSKKPSILIVDDEVDICDMISFLFENQGFQTCIAHDTEEAISIVKQHALDIVVSDVRMPKGGGLQLLKDIKQYNPDKPKVFLITGYSDATIEDAILAGAEAVLPKPIKLKDLVLEIDRVMNA